MIVDMSPGHRISPSKGGATWQVTITKSAIPKEKTLAGVCLSLLGASPLVPTDTPPPFSSRLSRCSHLDCRAAVIGVPLYIRAEAVIPLAAALMAKGVGAGTVLALIIGSAGASLTELILLRSLFTLKLLAAFLAVIFAMAMIAGYATYLFF